MKSTNELLAIIDDICPTIKSSEKLFLIGLVLDEQAAAYKEAVDKAMDNVNSMSEPDYSEIKEEYEDFEEVVR